MQATFLNSQMLKAKPGDKTNKQKPPPPKTLQTSASEMKQQVGILVRWLMITAVLEGEGVYLNPANLFASVIPFGI